MQNLTPNVQTQEQNTLAVSNSVNKSCNIDLKKESSKILKAIFISFLVFLLSIALLNASAQIVNTYNAPGVTSWTCPAGVTTIKLELWGAGGAGGGANFNNSAGGGGGGGAYRLFSSVGVTAGLTYSITVGAGGVGTTGNGGNGGVSSLSTAFANGGTGGRAATATNSGGAGGNGGGSGNFNGGNGVAGSYGLLATGELISGNGGGGAGSSGNGGNALAPTFFNPGFAGAGGNFDGGTGALGFRTLQANDGIVGLNIGGGGSGATKDNVNINNKIGGNGGDGQVRISYVSPCSTPTVQPTTLRLTASNTVISGVFKSANGASGYLVVMTTTAAAPSNPVNGTVYPSGAAALGGFIVSNSNSSGFWATNLTPGSSYWFWIFAYQAPTACAGTITYLTTSPLTASATAVLCSGTILTNTATITSTAGAFRYYDGNIGDTVFQFKWSALSWSLGHLPTTCEKVLISVDRSAATKVENITVSLDSIVSTLDFKAINVSNTSRKIVFAIYGTKFSNLTVNGSITIECPGNGISNKFNRCQFGNSDTTVITGDVLLGRSIATATVNEGHSSIGSINRGSSQLFNLYGNLIFNAKGFTVDEFAVFNFDKGGTQYIINNTRPLTTDTIQPVLFEDIRVGSNNPTKLVFGGSMFDGYIEGVGRAGLTIGVNSTLDLPANYSLNNIGGSASFLKMLAGSTLRLGGDKSINDVFGTSYGIAGSNYPNGLNNGSSSLDPTSTIEYYGDSTITQTIFNGITYRNLVATNSVPTGVTLPTFVSSSKHAQKITTGNITASNSFVIKGFADVTLGTLGSSNRLVTCNGPLNILTDGGLYCNANVVSGSGAFTMSDTSTLGIGHTLGIAASGVATGNIQMTGGRTYNTKGNYIYNGTAAQITGLGLPSAATNNLTIDNPTTVTIANNQLVNGLHNLKQGIFDIGTNKITINGNGTMTAVTGKMKADAGTVEMKGTSGTAQDLSGSWFVNKTISTLTNANTTGIKVAASPADTLLIKTTLDFGSVSSSTITTNDNLTLLSRFLGTANLGQVVSSNTISGKINIERYLTAKSAWRFIATPIQAATSPTVKDAWRENNSAFATTGYGTRLSGPAVSTSSNTGILDDYSVRYSMKSYNSASNTFTDMTNANTTNIANDKGYYVFVRGDRGTATALASVAAATNLRIKGDIVTGNQTFTIPAKTGTSIGLQSIGNPYPSRVSMSSISKNGTTVNSFTFWNPNSVGSFNVGAFETYTWDGTNYTKPGGATRAFIESGEAFYMQNNSTTVASTVVFKEADKATGSANVSRPGVTTPTLEINMYAQNTDGSMYLADGVKLNYNNAFSAGVDNLDVRKINNTYDNISIKNGVSNLIVERRPMIVETDTLQLNIVGMRIAPYRLDIDPSVLTNPSLEATLVDKFLNTRTEVSFTNVTSVDFAITSNAASRMVDRFMIVFKAISNTSFQTIAAARNANKTVKVTWTVQAEIAVTNYTIEHSNDGVNFTAIGTQIATANNGTNPTYTFTDVNATSNKNWYRVKANIGTLARYTSIAMVNELSIAAATNIATASIGIYPNPVVDGRVNLKLQNQAAGQYSVVITSTTGQILSRSIIKITTAANTNNITQTINLGTPSTGMYYATLIDEKGIKTTISFMVK